MTRCAPRPARFAQALAALSVAVLVPALGATARQPQEPLDLKRLSLEELGEVVVTSVTKAPEPIWRTAAAIHVLTADDIRRSGVTTVPEALRLVPGMQVARIDGSSWAIGIRGFANQFSQSLLVLVDGRSVYTPLFAGVSWAVQDLPLDSIDRIEVIRGPGGTIWGTNAVNGVINIITKHARETQGVQLAVGGGTVDRFTADARFGGGRGEDLHYRLTARAIQQGPQHHPAHGSFDDWKLGQITGRLDWRPSAQSSVFLSGRVYGGAEGKLTGIAFYDPPSQADFDAPQEVSGGHVLAAWRRVFGPGHELQARAYYDRTNRRGAQFGERRHTADMDVSHQLPLPGAQLLRWGAGVRWSPSTFEQMVQTVDFQPHDHTHRVASLFAQDEIPLGTDRVRATAGVKLEHNQYTGWEVQPSVRLLWSPSDRQTLWAAATRAVRIPSRLDRHLEINGFISTDPLQFIRIAGNPDFDSEKLVAYEAGYRTLLAGRVYVDVAAFHNRHSDLNGIGNLTVFPEPEPVPHTVLQFQYANAVEGSSSGVEISPSVTVTQWWSVRGAYSLLDLELANVPGINNPANVAAQEASSPRHQAFVQSIVAPAPSLELQQTLRAVSALTGQNAPAYQALDLSALWRIARALELAVAAHNVTDANHSEFGGTPGGVGIRRTVYAKVTWRP